MHSCAILLAVETPGQPGFCPQSIIFSKEVSTTNGSRGSHVSEEYRHNSFRCFMHGMQHVLCIHVHKLLEYSLKSPRNVFSSRT